MASGHVIKRAKYKTTAKGAGTPGVLKMVFFFFFKLLFFVDLINAQFVNV